MTIEKAANTKSKVSSSAPEESFETVARSR
jgi:hypothetical protein